MTILDMADHYLHSIERLDEIADLREQLRVEYAKPHHRREEIADLQAGINRALKLADIHATLAQVQQLEELNALLDERLNPANLAPLAQFAQQFGQQLVDALRPSYLAGGL